MRTRFEEQLIKLNTSLIEMGAAIEAAITGATKALMDKNVVLAKKVNLAKSVKANDDVVDDLFDTVKKDLFELIMTNVENCGQALDLLMIAKYYERIGDHAVNISEWVVYSITGEHKYKKLKLS